MKKTLIVLAMTLSLLVSASIARCYTVTSTYPVTYQPYAPGCQYPYYDGYCGDCCPGGVLGEIVGGVTSMLYWTARSVTVPLDAVFSGPGCSYYPNNYATPYYQYYQYPYYQGYYPVAPYYYYPAPGYPYYQAPAPAVSRHSYKATSKPKGVRIKPRRLKAKMAQPKAQQLPSNYPLQAPVPQAPPAYSTVPQSPQAPIQPRKPTWGKQ